MYDKKKLKYYNKYTTLPDLHINIDAIRYQQGKLIVMWYIKKYLQMQKKNIISLNQLINLSESSN